MAQNISIRLKYIPLAAILLALATLFLGYSPRAVAQTNIQDAIVTCPTCQTPAELATAATNYADAYNEQTPPGYVGVLANWGACSDVTPQKVTDGVASVIIVVSTSIAISQSFYSCIYYPTHTSRGYLLTKPVSDNTFTNAIGEDDLLFSRAQIANGRVTMPANLPFNGAGGSSIPSLWEEYISQVALPEVGAPDFSLWHMITGAPTVEDGTFLNIQTGQRFEAWNTDTIIATDSNGWTAEFVFTPGAPYNWMFVANSIRDAQGNPVDTTTSYVPVPGGVAEPIGPVNIMLPSTWGNIAVYVTPVYGAKIPEITVGSVTPDPGLLRCAALDPSGVCTFDNSGT